MTPRLTTRNRTGFWRGGEAYIWLSAGATAFAVLLILAVLGVIAAGGLGAFWPRPLVQLTLSDGTVYLGEISEREPIPAERASHPGEHRVRIRAANRDLNRDRDFVWIPESTIASRSRPASALLIERQEYGPFIGFLDAYLRDGSVAAEGDDAARMLRERRREVTEMRDRIGRLARRDVGAINRQLEDARIELRSIERAHPSPAQAEQSRVSQIESEIESLEGQYEGISGQIASLREQLDREQIRLRTGDGRSTTMNAADVYRVVEANRLNVLEKLGVYLARLWEFLSTAPREANLEGGILPAIFGTVMMTLLMTIAVVPLGVIAGLYLREYARQGRLVRIVRIAVNNLAGVPSIVFGIFGLGFFIYTMGGAIDAAFYPEALPTPTFGTGGILWSALTLALLTVPVVIVATEEGLASVPRAVREGSLALGATKWETTWRVVLPAASPGILTGVILAVSRAAGEVAPLMLTGAVKTANLLPVDSLPPFLHLERKFMHLGFHVYDLGFQSPNVEAAKPMVYMTTLLLVTIVVLLNLTAMWVRNRLWSRYRSSSF
jgi:phosphate transport system permease protein